MILSTAWHVTCSLLTLIKIPHWQKITWCLSELFKNSLFAKESHKQNCGRESAVNSNEIGSEMFKIGVYLILHGLVLGKLVNYIFFKAILIIFYNLRLNWISGIQCLPKQHHVIGRSGVQTRPNHMKNDLKANHRREPRDIHLLKLKDPLDCLSQVVCGLNTYPPQKPSVRTSTANDFAFLLKNSIAYVVILDFTHDFIAIC